MTFRKHAGLAALVIGASLGVHGAGIAQTSYPSAPIRVLIRSRPAAQST